LVTTIIVIVAFGLNVSKSYIDESRKITKGFIE